MPEHGPARPLLPGMCTRALPTACNFAHALLALVLPLLGIAELQRPGNSRKHPSTADWFHA